MFRNLVRTALASLALAFVATSANAQLSVQTQQIGLASNGDATLQALVTNPGCSLLGNAVVVGGSLTLLPPPGVALPTGGVFQVLPDNTFATTLAGWGVKPFVPGGGNCQALFPKIPIPPQAAGFTLHVQGLTVNPFTSQTATTQAITINIT